MITKAESDARRVALEAAARSCDQSGLPPSTPEGRQVLDRYISGELDGEGVIAELNNLHKKPKTVDEWLARLPKLMDRMTSDAEFRAEVQKRTS